MSGNVEISRGEGSWLIQGPQELQSKEPHLAHRILPQDLSRDRRSFAGYQAGGGWGGSWDSQVDNLIRSKDVG